MNTRFLMIASAIFMGFLGLAGIFFPQEIATYLDMSKKLDILLIQIVSALYFGFSMLNWMAKGNAMGGIYSRPVAIGNFIHFAIGAITLLKAVFKSELHFYLIMALTVFYTIFAVSFGYVFMKNPTTKNVTK